MLGPCQTEGLFPATVTSPRNGILLLAAMDLQSLTVPGVLGEETLDSLPSHLHSMSLRQMAWTPGPQMAPHVEAAGEVTS